VSTCWLKYHRFYTEFTLWNNCSGLYTAGCIKILKSLKFWPGLHNCHIVLNLVRCTTFYHYRSTSAMAIILKCLRVKTFNIFEDSRMAGACGMWRVGVFIATSYKHWTVCISHCVRSKIYFVIRLKITCMSCCYTNSDVKHNARCTQRDSSWSVVDLNIWVSSSSSEILVVLQRDVTFYTNLYYVI
jgi:hypothetical protein